uniref:Uncharacterized protein n=1 Tax=Macrostomum lignano TaxID=282301 RepID=A0A1I8FAU9_9PLAT
MASRPASARSRKSASGAEQQADAAAGVERQIASHRPRRRRCEDWVGPVAWSTWRQPGKPTPTIHNFCRSRTAGELVELWQPGGYHAG